ncbi:hypothetical protein CP02DC21_1771 [Chlamydia psittaci 02DC21]|nr:hypothetical protein CP02DC21_1771 [Chlamydia psittaci 02DC21]
MTSSNRTQTGPDRFQSVLARSNRTRPAQTEPDRLKPVLTGSNRTKT